MPRKMTPEQLKALREEVEIMELIVRKKAAMKALRGDKEQRIANKKRRETNGPTVAKRP